jgi:hypothetical protein
MLPIVEGRQPQKVTLHPAVYVVSWIILSIITILFNKWILDTAGFHYPALLTCWHLTFATLMTQVLARTTTLLDGRKTVKMTGQIYLRAILPIGVLYSLSLVCSNQAYLYLSVAFIQMLKVAHLSPIPLPSLKQNLGKCTSSRPLHLLYIWRLQPQT